MIRHKIVLLVSWVAPISSIRLQSLAPFGRLFHSLAFAVEVWQRWKVLRIVKADWNLLICILVLFFIATVHRLTLVDWTRLLALRTIHQTTQRVLLELDAPSDKALTFSRLDKVEERVHDCAEDLRVHFVFWSLWIDASF